MITCELNVSTSFVYNQDTYIGSSVIFKSNGELFCITAGHNLYGKDLDIVPNLTDWKIVDRTGDIHNIAVLYGDIEFAKKNDLVVMKLECGSSLDNFISLKLCSIPRNPLHHLMFRGKYEGASTAVTHRKLNFNSICDHNDNHFLCDFDKELLTNHSFSSGSDWLGGWSGSGLFIEDHKEYVCAGILIEIPNKGDNGQIQFVNVEVIKEFNLNFEFINAQELDFNSELSQKSLQSLINTVDDNAVKDWEANTENNPQLTFINRKLPHIYSDEILQQQKRKTVESLLLGSSYVSVVLTKNEQIHTMYQNAFKIFNLEDLDIYADDRKQARAALIAIKDRYESYLSGSLPKGFSASNIKLLAIYGINKWISDCSLNILGNE